MRGKKKVRWCVPVILSLRRQRRKHPWGSLASQDSLIDRLQITVRDLASKSKVGRMTPRLDLCLSHNVHAPHKHAIAHTHRVTRAHPYLKQACRRESSRLSTKKGQGKEETGLRTLGIVNLTEPRTTLEIQSGHVCEGVC